MVESKAMFFTTEATEEHRERLLRSMLCVSPCPQWLNSGLGAGLNIEYRTRNFEG
jgi:hypothetical protein